MDLRTAPRPAFTLLETLVVMAIIAVALSLLAPAIQSVRQAAQRTQCANQLRQIGMALHAYHNTENRLPPGCSYLNGTDPNPHLGWTARILPFIEQEPLWQQALRAFQQERFFEVVPPHTGLGTVVATYACPADEIAQVPYRYPSFQVAYTDYLGVEGTDQLRRDGVLFLDSRVVFTDITDGTSNTLLVGERPPSGYLNFGWWYAGWGQSKDGSAEMLLGARERAVYRDLRRCPADSNHFQPGRSDNQCDNLHFWSHHPGGAHFLFCDSSVRFLAYAADPLLPALATRAGGEPAILPD
jgi:prepilin-type N-terminal cleavage/methylation domain-containing protein/prepilin-type processing-associated H-X9-DG protein